MIWLRHSSVFARLAALMASLGRLHGNSAKQKHTVPPRKLVHFHILSEYNIKMEQDFLDILYIYKSKFSN